MPKSARNIRERREIEEGHANIMKAIRSDSAWARRKKKKYAMVTGDGRTPYEKIKLASQQLNQSEVEAEKAYWTARMPQKEKRRIKKKKKQGETIIASKISILGPIKHAIEHYNGVTMFAPIATQFTYSRINPNDKFVKDILVPLRVICLAKLKKPSLDVPPEGGGVIRQVKDNTLDFDVRIGWMLRRSLSKHLEYEHNASNKYTQTFGGTNVGNFYLFASFVEEEYRKYVYQEWRDAKKAGLFLAHGRVVSIRPPKIRRSKKGIHTIKVRLEESAIKGGTMKFRIRNEKDQIAFSKSNAGIRIKKGMYVSVFIG